jgi:signal transduction histidine kinase
MWSDAPPLIHPTGLFQICIVAAAWFGGAGPGFLAAVLATAVMPGLIAMNYPLIAGVLDLPRFLAFAITGLAVGWGTTLRRRAEAALRGSERELRDARNELERRVVERTGQLRQASEALRETQAELTHVNRVTAMGQLAASITHEVMQPITAGINGAQAALRWLGAEPPNLEEVRQALGYAVNEGNRAIDVIGRIRALIKKAPPRKEVFDIGAAILEIVGLTRGELVKNNISMRTQLTEGLPRIQGDKVQLQQVILNLIINAVEAMSSVPEGSRELLISTTKDVSGVLVAARDSGPGLIPESFERLFDAFYTTKADGMGMGLSICRAIVEAHGGRIWASRDFGQGATFQFTLPLAAA